LIISWLSDREWHVISKLQIDRNESGAHYMYNSKLEKQIDVEAGDTIKLTISIFCTLIERWKI
ncbi:MAG: hypothetical protein M1385_00690, partial [Candidatus Marsarchaeota archaeon]|nr:hypothetical protein [Candidatus Marsarchaeota archaeon]